MTDIEDLVYVAACGSIDEAHLYQGLLDQDGIPSSVHAPNRSDNGQAAELFVPREFEARAIELLKDVSTGSAESLIGDSWQGDGEQGDGEQS